jgi:GNAT superfamily N-acetyltransferase
MRIREAKPTDALGIAKVHVDSWRETYVGIVPDEYLARLSYKQREQVWQNLITTAPKRGADVLVVEYDEGRIVGFADGGPAREEVSSYESELYAIYILKKHQGKGLGTQLVSLITQRLLKDGMNSMMLWVLSRNPYHHFYEALEGERFKRRYVVIGGAKFLELAYGWSDIRLLATANSSVS